MEENQKEVKESEKHIEKKYLCKELDIKKFADDMFKFTCPSCGFRWNE